MLVTGGSEGIGLAIAAGAMRLGARVSILARDPAKLAAARARLGDDVVTQSADVTRRDALRAAVDAACTRYGDCDILVPAAGGAEPGNFLEMDAETFRRQIDLNYLGVVDTIRSVVPSMVRRARGHIVVISSVAGLFGVFGYGAYAPTKFAVRGLAETLDAEFRHRGIRVSIAYPPDTRTPGSSARTAPNPPRHDASRLALNRSARSRSRRRSWTGSVGTGSSSPRIGRRRRSPGWQTLPARYCAR